MGRWALAVLLLAMATGQLADPAGFVDVVASYRLGGTSVAMAIAGVLIGGELMAGAGLLAHDGARRRRAATIALGVTLAWTALGLQAFLRGLVLENCGCFGVYAAQPLRWWILIEDVEFVALALWVRRRTAPLASRARHDTRRTDTECWPSAVPVEPNRT